MFEERQLQERLQFHFHKINNIDQNFNNDLSTSQKYRH